MGHSSRAASTFCGQNSRSRRDTHSNSRYSAAKDGAASCIVSVTASTSTKYTCHFYGFNAHVVRSSQPHKHGHASVAFAGGSHQVDKGGIPNVRGCGQVTWRDGVAEREAGHHNPFKLHCCPPHEQQRSRCGGQILCARPSEHLWREGRG